MITLLTVQRKMCFKKRKRRGENNKEREGGGGGEDVRGEERRGEMGGMNE